MKKKRFTLEQHRKLGDTLNEIRDKLISIVVNQEKFYPHKVFDRLHRTIGQLDKFRSVMDSEVFREYPRLDTHELIGFYYGKHREPDIKSAVTGTFFEVDNKNGTFHMLPIEDVRGVCYIFGQSERNIDFRIVKIEVKSLPFRVIPATVYLHKDDHAQLEVAAAKRGVSLQGVVGDLLQQALESAPEKN